MRSKFTLTAATAALILGMAGVADAQHATPGYDAGTTGTHSQRGVGSAAGATEHLKTQMLHESKNDDAMVPGLNVKADKLSGMDIYGTDGKKIGDVDKVLADSSNQIKAVTVDVGGFLGIGAKEVVIPISQLQKGQKDRLQTSMTKDEIQNLQKYDSTGSNSGAAGSGASGGVTTPRHTAPR
jgi:sporulation protein YlmC with PRC-barrel domain